MDPEQPDESPASTPPPAPETTPTPVSDTTSPAQQNGPNPQLPAATGPAPETSNAVGGQIPEQQQPASQGPLVLHEAPHEGFRGVLDRVLDAIGGKTNSELYRDDQGNEYVQHPDKSAGQKWARVADLAITGAAQGLANGRGAGNMGKGLLSAVQAGKQIGGQDAAADASNQAQVKSNRIAQANYNLLSQKMLENQFALTRMQQDANDHDKSYEDAQTAQETALKSIPLGTYKGINDLPDLQKQHPEVLKDFYNTKNVVIIPHVDPDTGKHDGASFFLRRPGITQQILPPETPFHVATMNDKGDYELETQHSTEPMTQGEIDERNLAAHTQMGSQAKMKADMAKEAQATALTSAEIPLKKAQTGEAETASVKNLAEASKAKNAGNAGLPTNEDGTIDLARVSPADMTTARQIAAGDQRMSDIVGRGSPEQRKYWMQLAEAVDPSFTGRDFEVRQGLQNDFTRGESSKSIVSFNQFLSHVATVNAGIQSMRNTNSPWLNTPINVLRQKAEGDPTLNKTLAPIIAARTEYENFLNNDHALQTGDKEDARRILNETMSPAQMQESLRAIAHTAADRADALNDKYVRTFHRNFPQMLSPTSVQALQSFGLGHYAQRMGAPAQQAQPQIPAGATGTAPGTDGKLHYVDHTGKDYGVAQQ